MPDRRINHRGSPNVLATAGVLSRPKPRCVRMEAGPARSSQSSVVNPACSLGALRLFSAPSVVNLFKAIAQRWFAGRNSKPACRKQVSAFSFRNANRSILLSVCFLLAGCGYHVAGRYSSLPANLQTIAIPAFKNDTTRYRIEQRMTEAVIRQFIQRTKYKIVQDPANADAVLHGEVLSVLTTPMLFNATTGEVTMMLVTVHTKVALIDTRTQEPIYHANDMVFRQEYQISTDVQSFFQEQDPAFDRMARDFGSRVVSDVLEGF